MNRIDLDGRHAVVTGGGSGLGYAIACRLLQSGAKVAIWERDVAAGEKAAHSRNGLLPIHVDVADFRSVTAAVDKTLSTFRAIDILINNAGITGPNVRLRDYKIDDWNAVMNVNLNGVFYCSKAVLPAMQDQNYGRIVNIASVAGKDGNPNACAYSASKAAVIAITKSLGKELAGTEIRVNFVTPAAVQTPLFKQMSQDHIAFMLSKIPLGRFGRPEEIAGMVAWLASEECSFSTGAVFDLSGGRSTY